jgi:hypothetical protein
MCRDQEAADGDSLVRCHFRASTYRPYTIVPIGTSVRSGTGAQPHKTPTENAYRPRAGGR